ncbi:hypothetical protein K1719_037522 [Acacia pycnantha]|nr:hypothetical protein K1719_037522 [Acacia pycnantha]
MERFSHREGVLLATIIKGHARIRVGHSETQTWISTMCSAACRGVFNSGSALRYRRIAEFQCIANGGRRHTNDNFYNDICGGDESLCRTPVKHERHPFSSTPASRTMSLAPPLPLVPDSSAPSSIPSTLRFTL